MKKKTSARKPARRAKSAGNLTPRKAGNVKGGQRIIDKYDQTAKN